MLPFAVLADDLTGACDTGVQFSARGARVLVLAAPQAALPAGSAWDVVVRNTESRHLPPAQAASAAAQAVQALAAAGWPVRYKKIDSTLRGPLAAELAALPGDAMRVVCPAFPAAGRTVEQGRLLVTGTPVHETEIGRDRHNPVPESHLPALLRALGPVGDVGAVDYDLGWPGVSLRLSELHRRGLGVVVADAVTDAQLDTLAAALLAVWREGEQPLVAVGSAGLARALAAGLLPKGGAPARPPRFPCTGPVLVVAGSRSAATQRQVQALREAPGEVGPLAALALDPAPLGGPAGEARAQGWLAQHADALAQAARGGAATLLVSVLAPAAQDDAAAFALRSQRLNAALGALVAALAERVALGGLVLTGGDIARAVLAALGGAALQLGREVLPGIALGWPVGGARPGLPVVTKAGGFGNADALRDAVHFLRHGAPRS